MIPMTPSQKLVLEAWEQIQSADFETLQANSDLSTDDPEFDAKDSLTKAIAHLTTAAKKLTTAKALIPNGSFEAGGYIGGNPSLKNP